jgi:para-aminobenzoate synthetase component 1
MPQLRFLCFDSVLEFDHRSNTCLLTYPDKDPFDTPPEKRTATPTNATASPKFHAVVSRELYSAKVSRIKEHIREGDIYQANYTCRFDLERADDPFDVYARLRTITPAPYAAYLNFGDMQILSSSPERMLLRDGSRVSTSPIKGTIGAGESQLERDENRMRLLNSEKDRAELLMIVDLERNDLGKIAQTGTVRVDSLFHAEEYRSLFHLVSDISAEIDPSLSTAKVLQALLPGGSITGAPKRRAIEILSQLETTPRGIYTGCIGYLQPGRADFNIAIRTIIHQNQTYHVHAGGGIVADSQPEAEYEEMRLKALNMFRAIGLSEEEIRCLNQ